MKQGRVAFGAGMFVAAEAVCGEFIDVIDGKRRADFARLRRAAPVHSNLIIDY